MGGTSGIYARRGDNMSVEKKGRDGDALVVTITSLRRILWATSILSSFAFMDK
jgi:hypothetical protein